MCPLHLFWPPQRSCCYYCLWSPGPIFIIIIWLFILYSHLSHLSSNNSLNLDFNPTYVSTSLFSLAAAKICCYCLWSPGPIFIIIIWLFILYSHLSHLSFNFHWIWILIQLMCPFHLFMAAAKICCYCLSSPGPIFIIIIWLFSLYSHLSHLSFNNFIEFGF